MICTAGLIRQLKIALYLAPLGFRADAPVAMLCRIFPVMYISALKKAVYLAVSGYYLSQRLCRHHRLSHHAVRLYAVAVIRERDTAARHSGQICENFTLLSHCDGSVRINMDTSVAIDDILLHLKVFNRIRDRSKIRHCAHSSVAAVRRCL